MQVRPQDRRDRGDRPSVPGCAASDAASVQTPPVGGLTHRQCVVDSARRSVYGTIRAIRRDGTSFLAWARDDFACVIFNLRTPHTAQGVARTRRTFERLYDAALGLGGSFYLTYHRWARRDQWLRAYPRLPEFLDAKRRLDPAGLFRSDWYDHVSMVVSGAG